MAGYGWLPAWLAVVAGFADPQPGYVILPAGGALRQYTEEQIALAEKLNRADRENLALLPVLVTPGEWGLPETVYSPLPGAYDAARDFPKFLAVYLPGQVFGAYEYGMLVRWGPVSTGNRTSPTPSGVMYLNWKSAGRHSTVNEDWYMEWYFNIENRRGLAMHAYALVGRPASHGCIRLLRRDAQWLYEWGETWTLSPDCATILDPGTPVFLIGSYRFDQPSPWRSPDWLSRRVELPPLPPE